VIRTDPDEEVIESVRLCRSLAQSADGPAVSMRDVVLTYKGRGTPAVDHLTLSVTPGTIFGLLGPNGAGKSSAISLVLGLAAPSSGTVEVFGRDPRSARGDIGVVMQQAAMHADLSVAANLDYHLALYGLRRRDRQSRVAEALRLANLEDRAGSKVSDLSGGMARRLAIARALSHNLRLVVLDEPTLGVDPLECAALWQHIRQLRDDGRAVILCTNVMAEAEALCDEIVIIRSGRIVAGPETPAGLRDRHSAASLDDVFQGIAADPGATS